MQKLPSELYSVASVLQLEQLAIEQYGISSYTLMRRAGQAVVDVIHQQFPVDGFDADKTILLLCGAGNNAGDGYVIARLLKQLGYPVIVVSLIAGEKLKTAARQAYVHWLECGEVQSFEPALLEHAELIVDALLGTGLARDVSGEWATLINAVNHAGKQSGKTIVAVDVPSGLNASSGVIAGTAIRADYTVSFIGLKTGLFTGSGKACCGEIFFHNLSIPMAAYAEIKAEVHLLNNLLPPLFAPRQHDSHKNQFGHVLVVGGNTFMAGAVILTAKAALRSGAGLVSVFTRAEHITAINAVCPEIMVVSGKASQHEFIPDKLLQRVSHIVIGPGLGNDAWAKQCLAQVLQTDKTLVLDADALNLIAEQGLQLNQNCVLTPHPGEAARLLGLSTSSIAEDRFSAIKAIHHQYVRDAHAAIILKGSGSLIYDSERLAVCPWGNPAMATAGMGDVLSGIVAAFLAQGLAIGQAAETAVLAHALAGDKAAQGMTRGLLASDVIDAIPAFL